jgi:hypothetical protein
MCAVRSERGRVESRRGWGRRALLARLPFRDDDDDDDAVYRCYPLRCERKRGFTYEASAFIYWRQQNVFDDTRTTLLFERKACVRSLDVLLSIL